MGRIGRPELVEVGSGVHAYIQPDGGWMLNNTGVILGPGGDHVLVDTTSTESRNRALLAAVGALTGGRPRALVNTHHHGDHTFGNWLMPAGTPIIGHRHCREDVLRSGVIAAEVLTGPDYGHIEVRAPDVTFSGSMTLHLGDTPIELRHVGPAHTRGDVLVWLPEERVVFSGDVVFNGGQPLLTEGSLRGYPRALEAVRSLEPRVLVPGHGGVCRGDDIPRVLDDLADYAAHLEDLAREGLRDGRSPLEAARSARDGRFSRWQESERLAANLHRAYGELGGEHGAPLDMTRAWSDMASLHGGPITSLA
jgi:glyoxylase-like metal-dependent hydrolase (beta-lactamase superfamily II)